MIWTKAVRANKWADLITAHIKNLEERQLITRWNWLVLQIGLTVLVLIIVWKLWE